MYLFGNQEHGYQKRRGPRVQEKRWNTKSIKFFGLNPCKIEPRTLFKLRQEVGCPPKFEMDKCNALGIKLPKILIVSLFACAHSRVSLSSISSTLLSSLKLSWLPWVCFHIHANACKPSSTHELLIDVPSYLN